MKHAETPSRLLEDLKQGIKGRKIKSARFEVGELAEINPEELEDFLKENADFEFSIEERKARVRCKCGYEGMADIIDGTNGDAVLTCSKRGDIPEVVEGQDVKIIQIEVKE